MPQEWRVSGNERKHIKDRKYVPQDSLKARGIEAKV